ncbi:MAG: DUF559 domain-containing protein [Rhodococcus sp. (in: high G+C Gram-positive bacteria)]
MGVHTRAHLVGRGIRPSALTRLLPSTYCDGEPTYLDRCHAVHLWKPRAVFSHSTAAWMWGLIPQPVLVTATVAPNAQTRAPEWVQLHRRLVTPSRREGLPVVTIEQALFDTAVDLAEPELEALFDAAIGTQVNWKRLARLVDASPGRHGIRAVRKQLRTCCPRTLSEPERMVARALVARGFKLDINARIGPYFGDLVCRQGRVLIEIDGREFHIAPQVFTNDRIRQNWLIDDDWRVLRFSAAMVNTRLDEVVDEIIAVVRKRRRSRRAR